MDSHRFGEVVDAGSSNILTIRVCTPVIRKFSNDSDRNTKCTQSDKPQKEIYYILYIRQFERLRVPDFQHRRQHVTLQLLMKFIFWPENVM